jgi:hypothetical protein
MWTGSMWTAFVIAFGATLGVCAALTLAVGTWVWLAVAARAAGRGGERSEGERRGDERRG